MKAVLLAAGKGKRLYPVSENLSKLMIVINGKPFLEYVINDLISIGISDICIVIGHFGKQIKDHFGNGQKFGVNIEFVEQKELLGTANALYCVKNFVGKNPFLLYLPDTILSDSLTTYYDKIVKTNSEVHILVSKVSRENISNVGTIETDGNKIIKINEKSPHSSSNLAWAGIAIFRSNLIFNVIDKLSLSTRGEYEITEAMNEILNLKKDIEFQVSDKFLDLGTPKGLLEVMKFLLNRNHVSKPDKNKNIKFIQPVFVGKNCLICDGCTIGPFVSIEENVQIKNNISINNSLILNNSVIESSVDIENKIISPNGII